LIELIFSETIEFLEWIESYIWCKNKYVLTKLIHRCMPMIFNYADYVDMLLGLLDIYSIIDNCLLLLPICVNDTVVDDINQRIWERQTPAG